MWIAQQEVNLVEKEAFPHQYPVTTEVSLCTESIFAVQVQSLLLGPERKLRTHIPQKTGPEARGQRIPHYHHHHPVTPSLSLGFSLICKMRGK